MQHSKAAPLPKSTPSILTSAAGQHRAAIEAENARWRQNVTDLRFIYAEAERNGGRGRHPPLPHPDDVVIDPEYGISFVGPINEEEEARLKETLRFRDLLILQDALDEGLDNSGSNDPLDRGSGLVAALFRNDRVPIRFRLSDDEITRRMMRAGVMTKRDLLTTLYQGWKALGARPTRGRTLPPPRVLLHQIDQLATALREVRR